MRTKLLIFIFWCLSLFNSGFSQAICTLPNQLFPQDTMVICKDTSFQLALSQYPGTNFLWSTGETDTSINISITGKYWVDLNDGNCTRSDTVYIIFNSIILEPVTDTVIVCLNSIPAPLFAQGSNLLWYDSLPFGGNPSSLAPIPTTKQLGEKIYYVSQTLMGCESPRAALLVEVIDKPGFNLGENILIPCNTSGISLQVVAENYTSYRWTNGTAGPVYNATQPGTYILRGDNLCGYLVDTVIAVDCDTKCVHFPSAFTPNGDGLNDVFRASSFCPVEKFRMVISNRFGEIIFETRNPKDIWDGNWMGKPQPAGTYVFYCQYTDFVLKKDMFFKGSLQLIK